MRRSGHKWEPIGKGWYFCKDCHVWRHKDVLDTITGWGHGRSKRAKERGGERVTVQNYESMVRT